MAVTILVFVALLKFAVSMPDPNVNVDVKLNVNEGTNDICRLQRDRGFCKAYFPRFYYSLPRRGCYLFHWGGCDGIANRFLTYKECVDKCGFESDPLSADNITSLALAPGASNDNYNSWIPQPTPMSQGDAATSCNTQQGKKLACPLSGEKFRAWLQTRNAGEYYWFYGQQGTRASFNYYYWQSGYEIARRLGSGVNLWENDKPVFGSPAQCVKGDKLVTSENCETKLKFYCSP